MKQNTFFFCLIFFTGFASFSQVNPVQDLNYHQHYDFGNYYRITWQPPSTPHDTLLGYNIYRGNELYQFQTETYLTNIASETSPPPYGINGDGFLFYSDGDAEEGVFWAHVTAVYVKDSEREESVYTDSVQTDGLFLKVITFKENSIRVYPNPSHGLLNISGSNLKEIVVFDSNGKEVLRKKTMAKTEKIDLSGKSKGVYFMTLFVDDHQKFTKKIVLK